MRPLGTLALILASLTLLAAAPVGAAGSGERCAAAKIAAARKKASAKLNCYRRAVAHGQAVDQNCLTRAEARFAAAFAAAEQRFECATSQDADAIEAKVDQFAADVASELPATTTTTSSLQPTCGAPGIGCSGTCPAGSFCTITQDCFCGGGAHCVCSNVTFTTCTIPQNCPTTTSTLP